MAERKEIDPGTIFGQWTVLGLGDKQGTGRAWKCRCSCGVVKNILGATLRAGKSTRCAACALKQFKRKKQLRRKLPRGLYQDPITNIDEELP